MGRINFDELMKENATSNNSNRLNVNFFALKNDGDTAIVRFVYNSVEEFDLFSLHDVEAGEKRRRINCLRDGSNPLNACPLCEAGEKLQQKFFIRLIEYVVDPETNQITPYARIWERSARFALTLKNLIDEYGPLSENIFKIRRNGAKGSTDTTYSVMYGNPQVYSENLYPKAFNLFDSYNLNGGLILNKTAQEMNTFLDTGNFPLKKQQESQGVDIDKVVDTSPSYTAPTITTTPNPNTYTTPAGINTNISRPTRYY